MTNEKKFRDKQLLRLVWSYIKPHKSLFNWITVLLIIMTIVSIIAPLIFHEVISLVETGVKDVNRFVLGILAYLIISVAWWFINVVLFLLITRLNSRFIRDLRIAAYNNVLKNKLSFFDKQKSGNLSSRLVYDTREMHQTSVHLAWFIISIFQIIVTIVVLFYFSFTIASFTVLFMPVVLIASIFFAKVERRQTKKWREKFANVNTSFSEIMSKIQISKAFNREEENLKRFKDINEQTFKASVIRGLAIFIFWPITDLFQHIFTFIILIVGSLEVQNNGLPIATFVLFLLLINYFYWPLISVAENYKSIQDIFASLERIATVSQDEDLREINDGKIIANNIKGDIEFKSVTFGYSDLPVLKDLNFKISPGQRIALVGHTGAGKSTIGSLLTRFYDISEGEGEILLDGIPIKKYELNSYRKNVSIVSQRVLLFKGTIRENLLISNPNQSDDELWRILEKVQAKEFIELLPEGLDTNVEENGKNLSAGEKQMISFARALLSDPQVIIFDEATSAVDLYTESKILDAIEVVLSGRTSISIAHRLTTILNSDLIVVLEDGRIVEMGSHEELISRSGAYMEMYNIYLETQSAEYLSEIITH